MDLPFLDPGELRQQITIQQLSTSADAYGAATPAWSTLATVWAKVHQLKGSEQFYAHQVVELATHEVTIRYLAGVSEQMQIVWGARTLKIENVNDVDGRGIKHVLLCAEKK